jgi:hypothetical protein
MNTPQLAFVVGSFNRPGRMRTCLASLIDQTFTDIEIVVTDNSDDPECRRKIEELCKVDERIRYEWTHDRALTNFPRVSIPSLYDAAEIGVKMTTAPWLAFPNCDSYACPWFAERMLIHAEFHNLEFCYCDFVQGRPDVPHHFFDSYPEACRIDKTNFIMKREWFPEEWPGKVEMYGVADGLLVNYLVAKGIRHGKNAQVMVVHN